MVETLEEAKRRGKDDIPPIGIIKNIDYAPQWNRKFGYPSNKPMADYYVEFNYNHNNFGSKYLIEASKSNLHGQILQIEESAEFFRSKNMIIDTYYNCYRQIIRQGQKEIQTERFYI